MDVMPHPVAIALQVIPFLLTCFGLWKIIFEPMLDYLDERDRHIAGSRAEADELVARVEERTAEYQEKLTKAKGQIAELRARRRAEAMAAYEAKVHAARTAAEEQISSALVEIDKARVSASAQLETTAHGLAGDIAGQVLGRSVAAG